MRESMKEKLVAALKKQNPALAALCAAPTLSRTEADATLAEVYRVAPWSRDALAVLESGAPGTRDRYAAALASATGEAYEAVLVHLNTELARNCPF